MSAPSHLPQDFVRAQLAWIEANLASSTLDPGQRPRWERWRESTRTYLVPDDAQEAS